MANSNKTKLSQQQIFQRSFEENSDRIRVSLGDAEDDITVNPNGSINTVIQDADGNPISDLNPLHVIDDSVNVELDAIRSDLNSQFDETQSKQDSQIALLTHIDSDIHTVNSRLSQINTDLNTHSDQTQSILQTEFDQVQVKQDTQITELQSINTELDGIHSDLNIQLTAANTSLDNIESSSNSINNKINNNYGVSTGAIRTAAQLGNTSGLADFNVGPATAQTLRTIANTYILTPSGTFTQPFSSGTISGNTTTSTLGANGTYTGTFYFNEQYTSFGVLVTSNVNSAIDGVKIQFSHDGSTVLHQISYTYIASNGPAFYAVPSEARYFRVIYTNGTTAQSSFAIITKSDDSSTSTPTSPLYSNISNNATASITKAVAFNKTPDGEYTIVNNGGVDSGNSSKIPLGINGVFTGIWKDISPYSNLSFMVNSNVPGVLSIQYSTDGITVHRTLSGDYNADPNGLYITLPPETQYYRLIYTNGGIAQSSFSLQSVLTTTSVGISTVPLNFPIVDSNSVAINRSVITGKSTNGQYVNQRAGGVSTGNSTSTLLAANEEFTGVWEDVLGYANMSITSISDVASAVDGLHFEYSSDGINVDAVDSFTTVSNLGNQYSTGATTKYFRVRYVNGPTNQTMFRLQTIYHIAAPKPSTHRIDDIISGQNDAELAKSVITGKQENGAFNNVGLSNSAGLKVAITDRPSEVRNRVKVEKRIFTTSLTATPTIIHTVTPGYTFYLESMITSTLNNANAIGDWRIADGATDKIGFLLGEKVTGVPATGGGTSPALPEPIPFTTSFNVREVTGDITVSIYIIGYEELN